MNSTQNFYFSARQTQHFRRLQHLLDRLQPEAAPKALLVPGSPRPEGDIVVFPGSFNPPTTAHIALLKQARHFMQYQQVQKGIGTPKGVRPLVYAALSKRTIDKESVERPLLLDRIVLLEKVLHSHLAQSGIILFNRGLYVDEARAIRTSFPKVKRLIFLVGFDKIVQILDPRYYEDRDAALRALFDLAEILVAPRGKSDAHTLTELLQQPENQPFAHSIHALPFSHNYLDISSTQIRQNPQQHLRDIPPEVRRFLSETHAYASPLCLDDGRKIDYYAERVKALEGLL